MSTEIIEQAAPVTTEPAANVEAILNKKNELLAEVKALKAKLAEQASASLAEQGKYKELYEQEIKKSKDAELSLLETNKLFAKKAFESKAKSIGLSMGADPSAIDDLLAVHKFNVEIGENFEINEQQLKDEFAKLQTVKSWAFAKNKQAPKDVTISSFEAKGFDFEKASKEDIINQLKNLK